jgi:hypothetical protein
VAEIWISNPNIYQKPPLKIGGFFYLATTQLHFTNG